MSDIKTYHTKSSRETQEIAKKFASEIKQHTIICLSGDLGAGKTTFMQGFIEGLGLPRRLVSPTFILMRTYELGENKTLYHADLYRLLSENEVEGTGLLEAMSDPSSIVAIEWPDRLGSLLPEKRIDVRLRHGEAEDDRLIEIENI